MINASLILHVCRSMIIQLGIESIHALIKSKHFAAVITKCSLSKGLLLGRLPALNVTRVSYSAQTTCIETAESRYIILCTGIGSQRISFFCASALLTACRSVRTNSYALPYTGTYNLAVDDTHIKMADNKYLTGYAKMGTSKCKKCKEKIDKGALRIAKLVSNPFSEVSLFCFKTNICSV